MRVRLSAVLLAVCLCAVAENETSVNSVVATVRTSLRKKHKDAELAAALDQVKLAEHLEDRVIEILESEGTGPQSLGALQRLRDASRLLPLPSDPPPGMTPPPPPSAEEEHRVLQTTGAKALDYTRSLPDFICTETVHRWTDPAGNEAWKPSPTVVADLTFFERRENYKLLTVDGHPVSQSLPEVGGAFSQGEFGSILSIIFSPTSETYFRWDHWTILRKHPAHVFFFRISAARAPHHLLFGAPGKDGVATATGVHGFLYVDRETNSVTRIAQEAEDIPADFPVQKSSTVLDYDYAGIGGTRFLLPLRAEVRIDAGKLQSLNTVEFHAYRKFASAATVKFGTTTPVKK
jgi:hypothetical protein